MENNMMILKWRRIKYNERWKEKEQKIRRKREEKEDR